MVNVGHSTSVLLAEYGPTIRVDIGFDKDFKMNSLEQPNLDIKGVEALIDTGASESCIDVRLAAQLNLPMVDTQDIAGSNGAHKVPMFLAQIYIPDFSLTLNGMFAGLKLIEGGQIHKAILGRSFLKNFKMTYEGVTGSVNLEN